MSDYSKMTFPPAVATVQMFFYEGSIAELGFSSNNLALGLRNNSICWEIHLFLA